MSATPEVVSPAVGSNAPSWALPSSGPFRLACILELLHAKLDVLQRQILRTEDRKHLDEIVNVRMLAASALGEVQWPQPARAMRGAWVSESYLRLVTAMLDAVSPAFDDAMQHHLCTHCGAQEDYWHDGEDKQYLGSVHHDADCPLALMETVRKTMPKTEEHVPHRRTDRS